MTHRMCLGPNLQCNCSKGCRAIEPKLKMLLSVVWCEKDRSFKGGQCLESNVFSELRATLPPFQRSTDCIPGVVLVVIGTRLGCVQRADAGACCRCADFVLPQYLQLWLSWAKGPFVRFVLSSLMQNAALKNPRAQWPCVSPAVQQSRGTELALRHESQSSGRTHPQPLCTAG